MLTVMIVRRLGKLGAVLAMSLNVLEQELLVIHAVELLLLHVPGLIHHLHQRLYPENVVHIIILPVSCVQEQEQSGARWVLPKSVSLLQVSARVNVAER